MISSSAFTSNSTTFDPNNIDGIEPSFTHTSPACFVTDTPDVTVTLMPELGAFLLAVLDLMVLGIFALRQKQ